MNGRKRLLLIQRILQDRTDEKHDLSVAEITAILQQEYSCAIPDRATIYEDIRSLQASGMDIIVERKKQNRYYFTGRFFDRAELKLLIDAVKSFKFITKRKSDELAEKIAQFAGPGREGLVRSTEVENRTRSGNKRLFLIIDILHQAIEEKRQVSFLYFKYNEKKEQVLLHRDKPYHFNPFFLAWNGEYYYIVGSYANHPETVASFRIDRIYKQPVILEQKAARPPKWFDAKEYLNSRIHMFGGIDQQSVEVTLLCANETAPGIIDRFGLDAEMMAADESHFWTTVSVVPTSVFYGWVFGFGGKVQIVGPKEALKGYKEMVEKVSKENG